MRTTTSTPERLRQAVGSERPMERLRDEVRQHYLDLMAAICAARASGLEDNSEAMLAAVRAELAPRYGTWQNFPAGLAANISGVLRWWAMSEPGK